MSEVVVKTAQDAIEALRQVVAGREDFVYDSDPTFGTCVNFARDAEGDLQPSCIVGHVVALWGLEPEFWSVCQEGMVGTLFNRLQDCGHWLRADYNAQAVLNTAQHAQDDRLSWGYALGRAEETRQIIATDF